MKTIFLEDLSEKKLKDEPKIDDKAEKVDGNKDILNEEKKAKSGLKLYKTWAIFLRKCLKDDINLGAVKRLLAIACKSGSLKENEKMLKDIQLMKESKTLDINFKKYSEKYPSRKSDLNSLKSWYFSSFKSMVQSEIKRKSKLKEDFESYAPSMSYYTTHFVNDLIDDCQDNGKFKILKEK